jgi:ribosomal-protein-alanine N-acetyltransferase
VAYYLAEKAWGKGYMTEILKRVIDFCFDELGLNRVEADHFARNPASGRVMEKAGMTKEGLARQKYCKDGEFLDAVLYAIVKGDRE